MNDVETQIYLIIEQEVCGLCRQGLDSTRCDIHYDRCHDAYQRQAERIYNEVFCMDDGK